MENETKQQGEVDRSTVIAAVYAVNKAAKKQRDLGNEGYKLLVDEDVDASLSKDMQVELDHMGLQWYIELNGVSLSPFAYAPAFYDEKWTRPDKWPDARGTAIDELEIMGMPYDDDDEEYMTALTEQAKLAEIAIYAAEATIDGLHEILHAAKERWKCLRVLEAEAISKLRIPFAGFRYDENEHVLHACFEEGSYKFCMLTSSDETTGHWKEIGVEEVDELLWGLGCDLPELLPGGGTNIASTESDEEELLSLSEEEAVTVLKEFLVS